jgi:hypothetical protein
MSTVVQRRPRAEPSQTSAAQVASDQAIRHSNRNPRS